MECAYMVGLGPGEDKGRILLVVEDGYKPLREYDSSPKRRRKGIVRRLNKRLGLTPLQVDQIIARSMRAGCED